jgi:SAM-dependent methyltransferase
MSTSLWRRVERRLRRRFPSRAQKRHELVGPAHVWREKRDFQIAFLRGNGLLPASTLLDIGCGTLRGGVPIIEYLDSGNYTGVDVRSDIEAEARSELREHALDDKRPHLLYGADIATVDLETHFDFAWAHSVLFHMTDEHLDACLAFVRRHLQTDGVFFANVRLGEHPSDTWREFPLVWRTLDAYRRAASIAGLSVDDLGTVGGLGYELTLGEDHNMLRIRIL